MNAKPRRVKAVVSRVVTEVVIATLDKDGNIEEIEDVYDELDSKDEEVLNILEILSIGWRFNITKEGMK